MPSLRIALPIAEPTERLGLSVPSGFWNTIWRAAMSSGLRRVTGIIAMCSPSNSISPPVAVSRPVSTRAKVDLPQPDSPTIARV